MAVKDRDRFSTATRLKLLGEQTAARVYRSQTKRQARRSRLTGRAALARPRAVLAGRRARLPDKAVRLPARRDRRPPAAAGSRRDERVEQLRDLKARWQDDAYAEQQIRQRLHYVMPGETGYIVIDPDAAKQSRADLGAADRPWYANVWDGVDKSDASDQ